MSGDPALEIKGLRVAFPSSNGTTEVVRGVDLRAERGKVVALLGESGSGKSVTLRAIVGLAGGPGTKVSGLLKVAGRDVMGMSTADLADMRGRKVGFIFQEPMTALDPVFRVGDQIAETLARHRGLSRDEGWRRAKRLFDLVQIPSAERRLRAYPSELSGGLRQRAMIAMALCCEPELLLADEPTTALDATVQIQVLLLLRELQRELGTSMIFVTHDLGVAAEIADEVAVMYAGRIVETGTAEAVLVDPAHPYTQALTGCVIRGSYRDQRLTELTGSPPDPANLPPGCSFSPRCSARFDPCDRSEPALVACGPTHGAACLRLADAPGAGSVTLQGREL